ncbi:multi-sensor hybrid histidine kinase [Emticicia oligotrophica DSM 17448]|uniref:histidine kinase n=1 Tax=Emticicia oligotrophica (strain DSM 17448 / CIP 109782 / MTCC 6937 / GPTSA100-15) TaxID=929562 RepID=A0ABM5N614_EMTOG|nr:MULTISPECIES: ATP-binding protein [Emticicia]AFK04965.1 multi-sensor hybrid histidine kinase [Emticicia oligotrophica DSM 17448]
MINLGTKIDVAHEISLLYELSLSIGNSLDLRDNCANFLNVWMRQKNIDFGSIWIKNEHLNKPNPDNHTLIYANPEFSTNLREITLNHYLMSLLDGTGGVLVKSGTPLFHEINTEQNIHEGIYWIIPLPQLGFIKFYFSQNNASKNAFTEGDSKKAAKVIKKFAISLQSSLLHNRVIEETKQKIRYQEELKKLAVVAEKTDNAIVITDAQGKIEWVNQGFSRITGYFLNEVKGKTPGEVLQGQETNIETRKYISEQIKLRNSFRTEILNYSKTGEKYWVELSIQPIYDNEGILTNFIAIESDITDRKNYEARLQEAKEKAEEASRVKQEFLAVVSHEIRTPLNAILGMMNLIQKTHLTQLQTDYISTVQISAENLQGIINSILDFSKIETGKMTLQKIPFNLKKTLQNIISSNEFKAEQKGIGLFLKFDEKLNTTVTGDSIRLSQVLLNLVSNAIKFTEIGRITIEARLVTKMNNALVVEFVISDTGKGIAPENLKLIFESFTQEDSSISRKYGGTGLGLSISKQLIEIMGGDLRVKSELGKGSTFTFVIGFPISQEPLDEIKQSHLSSNSLIGKKILLVEDNAMNQFFAQKLLEGWGMKVEIAHNGREGVEKFRSKYYDCILMDIQMPEMDGFQATKLIRAESPKIPIIALTALMIEEEIDHFTRVGMNDYIGKPFVADELLAKLVKHISNTTINYTLTSTPKVIADVSEMLYSNSNLEQLMKGDSAQIKQMELLFMKQSEEAIEQFIDFTAKCNWKQIGLLAHKIKASIDMLQITSLKQPIRQLEILGKSDKELPETKKLISLVTETLQKVCEEIKSSHQ